MQILTTFVKVAVRNIARHKLFTFINLVGLALSMSVGMLIIAMIFNLLDFDHFHAKKNRIYRITSTVYDPTRSVDEKATAPLPLAEKLKSISQVDKTVRIRKSLADEVLLNNIGVNLNGYFTEPSFLDVFSFPIISGNEKSALANPYSIVLTRKTALKLFKTEDVLGKTITFKRLGTYEVTGLLEDIPLHSHLQFEALASISTVPILEKMTLTGEESSVLHPTLEHWDRFFTSYVYLLLAPGSNQNDLQRSLTRIASEVYPDKNAIHATFSPQSLLSIVPGPNLSSEIGSKMIYLALIILSALAFIILIAACFNYTNLSIARALQRAKEVGLRKISGATRLQIVSQFLLESVLVALLALIISISIYGIITPHVMENIPRATELFDLQLTVPMVMAFTGFAVFTGLLAGILPALALSHVNIVEALKQIKNIKLAGRMTIRNALVVFQFTLSLFLFTAMAIMYQQYQYSLNKDLGFKTDNLLVVDLNGTRPQPFVNAIRYSPDVTSVTFSSRVPGTSSSDYDLVVFNNGRDSVYINSMSTESHYINDLRFEFLAGSNFPDSAESKNFIIVNEKFLPMLKARTPIDALNETVVVNGESRQIIGVVKDFHYSQLENPIQAFFFKHEPAEYRYANIRVNSSNIIETMAWLKNAWKSVNGTEPFSASFFDARIQETYEFFVKLMRIFGFVGLLAMAIAVLGLLGMASYTTERRTKEIGIRKVLGAEVFQIIVLLSKGFVGLLLIAACIALPAAYFLFDRVILDFNAYRITIGFLEMFTGFIVLLVVGSSIILSQTMKAALTNPVNSLRTE